MKFWFKLKAPYNHIAGGGFFVRHSIIPLSLAWQAFGEKNGATVLGTSRYFKRVSDSYRRNNGNFAVRPAASESGNGNGSDTLIA